MQHRSRSHHPGPPRFTYVGGSVELAPRNPDPDATFSWSVVERPDDSDLAVDDGPVVHLAPDAPGLYRLTLDAPDGTHHQVVRAFPDPRRPARFELPVEELGEADPDEVSVFGPFNDYTLGSDRPSRDGDSYAVEFDLLPDDHEATFVVGDFERSGRVETTVEGPGRPRVRLDATVDGGDVIVTATAEAAPDGRSPDVEFYLDDRDALEDEAVEIDGLELRVPVETLPEAARIHAVAVAERHSVADTVVLDATGDGVSIARPNNPPEWARDAVLYEIFVRSFAGETVETTFAEIERRVEYLESLGIDAVWLTPVLESPTEHGYHITDFFDTASDLGSREEFASLVERLHESDVRVLFDLVINHTSRDHPAFQMHSAGLERYADYYPRIPAEEDASSVDWAGDGAPAHYFNWTRIPNVNYDSLAVRSWMLDVVDEWASVVDGFRCDVAWGVPHSFWKEVRDRVRDADAEFLLMDETIPRDPDFHECEFDVHYDTALYEALRDVGAGDAPADAIFDALADSRWRGFPDDALHMRYVENHDEDRYLAECDEAALRAAAAATFTLPGVPMIYYGQERGVEEMRGMMRWHDGDADLTDFHRALVRVREENPALRFGRVERVAFDVDGDGGESGKGAEGGESVTAFARESDDGDRLVVVLNFDAEPRTVRVERAGTTDLLTDRDAAVEAGGGVRVEDAVVLRGE